MNLNAMLQLWKARRKRELTATSAEQVLAMLVRWERAFGEGEVTPALVEAYRLERDDGQRSASALNREGQELKRFFGYCIELGEWDTKNPATIWKWRKEVIQREYVVLSPEDEETLVKCLDDDLLCRYVRFSIATGIRQGTVRRLTWGMVEGQTLVIPPRLMKEREPLRMPLSRKAWAALRPGGLLLFPGLPSTTEIWRRVKRAAKIGGLRSALSPHDFRRTWVARMRDAGASMADVMQLGGWRRPTSMLLHYFAQVPEERARRLLEAI